MQTKPGKSYSSPSYGVIGQFYDDLWGEHTRAWQAARRRLLKPLLAHTRQVCELGCGTGTTAIEYARLGLEVFALDFSPVMCQVTRRKARAEGLDVRVRQADMRTFRLPVQVDLITSEWGVINHLPRRADLARTFRAVAGALRPGGYFYFDLHQRKLYEEKWSRDFVGEDQQGKTFAAQRGGYDRSRGKGWIEVTFFGYCRYLVQLRIARHAVSGGYTGRRLRLLYRSSGKSLPLRTERLTTKDTKEHEGNLERLYFAGAQLQGQRLIQSSWQKNRQRFLAADASGVWKRFFSG